MSGNVCAFKGCDLQLSSPDWKSVRARVAHIRGEKPGSARYDASMSHDERRDLANLLLLCPNHHNEVDDLRPDEYSVQDLTDMKQRHEEFVAESIHWPPAKDDAELEVLVRTLISVQFEAEPSSRSIRGEASGTAASAGSAVGDARAFDARVEALAIIEAVYGPSGEERNVTGQLQRFVNNGRLDIPVSNDVLLSGEDPWPGRPKTLTARFSVNGLENTRMWSEGDRATLPP